MRLQNPSFTSGLSYKPTFSIRTSSLKHPEHDYHNILEFLARFQHIDYNITKKKTCNLLTRRQETSRKVRFY